MIRFMSLDKVHMGGGLNIYKNLTDDGYSEKLQIYICCYDTSRFFLQYFVR